MAKKKGFFLTRWFKRAFLGSDQEVRDFMQEEQVQTPFRTMAHNFFSKHTVRIGLIGFFLIFLFVLIGPRFWVLDLSDQDSTLTNLPPSSNMMGPGYRRPPAYLGLYPHHGKNQYRRHPG